VPIADLFNWTLEFTIEAPQCPIKGEKANTVGIGGIDVRLTAERFVDNAGGATLANEPVILINATPGTGVEVTYALDQLAGTGGASITGSGVVVRGGLTAPRGLANDTFELVGTTVPTVT
jgi:hypothetical protein